MNKIGLFVCIAVTICAVSRSEASPLMSRQDAAEYKQYMHDNCAKAKAPFEVLIQGPAGNRFVRSLLPSDLMNESNDPKKRSTISIFHPDENKDVFAYADSEADRKLMKRESETETPSKLAADEAKDAEATSTAAPEAAKSNESASTTEAPKKADQADAEHKVKRDSENEAKSESEAKSDSADDSNTTPADNSSTTEAATAKPAGEHKVKRDTATDLIENIAEIEAKAEAGESVLPEAAATEPTVGLALPVAPALLPLKAKIQALKTQLIGYKAAKFAPVITDVQLIPAKIAALKAKLLAPPVLFPIAPII